MDKLITSYKEIMDKYGDCKVSFSSYYKYIFVFTGEGENGEKIRASYGGHGDDIYRFDVGTQPVSIASIEPCSINITGADGVVLADYSEW